jgi:hypothetical protein
MPPSSGRGQVEPLAALAAVLAVSAGLALYGGVLDGTGPDRPDRRVADEVLDSLGRGDGSVSLAPADLRRLEAVLPAGWEGNATLRTGAWHRSVGSAPPPGAVAASRPVGVSLAPGRVRPGRVTVEVWR